MTIDEAIKTLTDNGYKITRNAEDSRPAIAVFKILAPGYRHSWSIMGEKSVIRDAEYLLKKNARPAWMQISELSDQDCETSRYDHATTTFRDCKNNLFTINVYEDGVFVLEDSDDPSSTKANWMVCKSAAQAAELGNTFKQMFKVLPSKG